MVNAEWQGCGGRRWIWIWRTPHWLHTFSITLTDLKHSILFSGTPHSLQTLHTNYTFSTILTNSKDSIPISSTPLSLQTLHTDSRTQHWLMWNAAHYLGPFHTDCCTPHHSAESQTIPHWLRYSTVHIHLGHSTSTQAFHTHANPKPFTLTGSTQHWLGTHKIIRTGG